MGGSLNGGLAGHPRIDLGSNFGASAEDAACGESSLLVSCPAIAGALASLSAWASVVVDVELDIATDPGAVFSSSGRGRRVTAQASAGFKGSSGSAITLCYLLGMLPAGMMDSIVLTHLRTEAQHSLLRAAEIKLRFCLSQKSKFSSPFGRTAPKGPSLL